MLLSQFKRWLPVILAPILFSGCCHFDPVNMDRSHLIAKLQHEMASQTNWLRIHAAEALLDNGESNNIVGLFKPEADTASAPYRIGVWRVLARASGAERQGYVERIRAVLHDSNATDRISASESLGKLDAAKVADSETILQWLTTADDATAAFPRWLLCLSSSGADRESNETALAKYLRSSDAVARLRAGFVLGRLKNISPNSVATLREQLKLEPNDSIARVYLITALLLHSTDATEVEHLKKRLRHYLHGKANEQLEAGIVLGMTGSEEDLKVLGCNLENSEPDARIGAANGMLRLLK